jgi:hypothetical protein
MGTHTKSRPAKKSTVGGLGRGLLLLAVAATVIAFVVVKFAG